MDSSDQMVFGMKSGQVALVLPAEMLFFPGWCLGGDEEWSPQARVWNNQQNLIKEWKKKEELLLNGRRPREDTVKAAVSKVYKHKIKSKPCKWLGVFARAYCYGWAPEDQRKRKTPFFLRLIFLVVQDEASYLLWSLDPSSLCLCLTRTLSSASV